MEYWIRFNTHNYVRKGGKIHRRNVVKLMITIANDIKENERGVRLPTQIGKAHIHRYYERHQHLSKRTLQDHYYAIRHLWELLERPKSPPRPKNFE